MSNGMCHSYKKKQLKSETKMKRKIKLKWHRQGTNKGIKEIDQMDYRIIIKY